MNIGHRITSRIQSLLPLVPHGIPRPSLTEWLRGSRATLRVKHEIKYQIWSDFLKKRWRSES